MSKGMITSIDTVTQLTIKFREKQKEHKKMGTNVEHNTKYIYEWGLSSVLVINKHLSHHHVSDTHTQELES